jgi:hypothetical protein
VPKPGTPAGNAGATTAAGRELYEELLDDELDEPPER